MIGGMRGSSRHPAADGDPGVFAPSMWPKPLPDLRRVRQARPAGAAGSGGRRVAGVKRSVVVQGFHRQLATASVRSVS